MIDFVKVRPKQSDLALQLRSDKRLLWTDRLDRGGNKTGIESTYHALTWYVANSGFVEVKGSLHKCWNSVNGRPAENWNDFKRLDLFDVIYWLADEFGIDLTMATVHNLEFGVNLIQRPALPTVQDVLSKLLYYGSGKPFVEKFFTPGYEQRLITDVTRATARSLESV